MEEEFSPLFEKNIGSEECTAVIVTGSYAKNNRVILMKNRDASARHNALYYYPATEDTYAFEAINSMWMGINEKGLAVASTWMPALAESPESGMMNGYLNRIILETCENVSEVEQKLLDENSPIGPTVRCENLSVATCIGVVDRFGNGAFFEISDSQTSTEYVENGYQSRANHPRTFPGLASGPYGRDQYVLDELDEIYQEKGVISWQDIAQRISRDVNDQEQGSIPFEIVGQVSNNFSVASMVAVSGDSRYDGKLNIIWTECGRVPMVGVYVPSMVQAGPLPSIQYNMHNYTTEKQEYALAGLYPEYDPQCVREIQEYAFAAENYTFEQYDRLMNQMHEDLNETELQDTITDFIELTVSVAVDMYVNETSVRPEYAEEFNIEYLPDIPSTTSSLTNTDTTTITDTTTTTTITTPTDTTTTSTTSSTPIQGDLGSILIPVLVTCLAVTVVLITIDIIRRR
ncbi:MAG: carcinine hydrolase/isopenicillin-N N-acyltransferase family protein [Candidatus Thorarchaeota archaeon]|jgi:hypothetical protein